MFREEGKSYVEENGRAALKCQAKRLMDWV